jgi:hypothetical protein
VSESDIDSLRDGITAIEPAVSHRANEPPAPSEIYAPSHHISALDPDNPIVVGIRGVGKSFWAGVLGNDAARAVAASVYPRLGLAEYHVEFGFTGDEGRKEPSPDTVQQFADNPETAKLFWRVVILRSLGGEVGVRPPMSYRDAMKEYSDPEKRELLLRDADNRLKKENRRFLLVFDALDRLSTDWTRLRTLTKALLQVTYGMRSYQSIRLKLFLRPEQLDDPAVAFTDLSKLKAAKIDLSWDSVDLYGLFFAQLANNLVSRSAFERLLERHQVTLRSQSENSLPTALTRSAETQEIIFVGLAGRYMGSDHRKGKTYSWLPSHLADGFNMVSPRSFLKALREAAVESAGTSERVLSVEGIKEGLRAASRMRVEQIKEEYQWIELALGPLAGLRVPCSASDIIEPWLRRRTTDAIEREVAQIGYLAPSEMSPLSGGHAAEPQVRERGLLATLLKVGVLQLRDDGRINMPDIFRIGAALIGRGRVSPEG